MSRLQYRGASTAEDGKLSTFGAKRLGSVTPSSIGGIPCHRLPEVSIAAMTGATMRHFGQQQPAAILRSPFHNPRRHMSRLQYRGASTVEDGKLSTFVAKRLGSVTPSSIEGMPLS